MTEPQGDFDDELTRLLEQASALIDAPDADGDGEPDGFVEPSATAGEAPLLFERGQTKPSRSADAIVGGKPHTVARGAAKIVSPGTLKRASIASGRGTAKFANWAYNYYNAVDKADLRLKNPRAHHEITLDRRKRFAVGVGSFILLSLIVFYAIGIVAPVAEFLSILGILMLVGRNGKPILDAKAGEDIGMGETRVQRAIARAVFNVDLNNEKYRDWHKNIIVRDGWTKVQGSDTRTIRIGLPYPHHAGKAKAKLKDIAAALDLTHTQVRIVEDPSTDNAGDFDLIVYGGDPWNVPATFARVVQSPCQTNIWDGIDFGQDIDRQPVVLDLIKRSMLIGGLPDMGKTTTALTLMANIVLDPYVRTWVADAKGVDTTPLIPLAYRYVGASQEELIEMLDEIEAWGRKKLAALKDVRKQSLSRDMAQMWRQIDPNHPLSVVDVVYIDEARFYTNGAVDAQSKRIVDRLSRIIEMFRAVGIVVIIATQRPSAKNIPTDIRDLVKIRLAHACTTPTMSNFILGEGAAGEGYSAHVFDEQQQGVGWLRILKSFVQMRPHLTDYDDLERCCVYAYDLRQRVGTLPEQIDASGVNAVPQVLLDVEMVMNSKEWDKVPTNVLIPLMARLAPAYDGISATDLAAKLANYGVGPNGIGEWLFEDGKKSANVRGYRLKWIQEAIERAKKGSVKK